MPANLTPDYRRAEAAYRAASEPEEKLSALQQMLAAIPKHKGTEKLQADLKKRLARLRHEVEIRGRKRGWSVTVEREGAGQIAVVGAPNSGKSSLVAALTGVDLQVAPYPWTTIRPQPAMMPFEDVQVQLVDLPPVSAEHLESWVPGIVRTADAVLLVADPSSPAVLEEIEEVVEVLERRKVRLVAAEGEGDDQARIAEKRTLLVGAKMDLAAAREAWPEVEALYLDRFGPSGTIPFSPAEGIETMRVRLFGLLRRIRVYSKPPGHEPDRSRPFVLDEGATLLELARHVHHDFAEHLKFARVWGGHRFEGQRLGKEDPLLDGDVVELHV